MRVALLNANVCGLFPTRRVTKMLLLAMTPKGPADGAVSNARVSRVLARSFSPISLTL
jgi:hypothetical protein